MRHGGAVDEPLCGRSSGSLAQATRIRRSASAPTANAPGGSRHQRSADAAARAQALLVCPEWKYGGSAPAYTQLPSVRSNAGQKFTGNGSTIDVELHPRISPCQPYSPAKRQAGEGFNAFHRPASSVVHPHRQSALGFTVSLNKRGVHVRVGSGPAIGNDRNMRAKGRRVELIPESNFGCVCGRSDHQAKVFGMSLQRTVTCRLREFRKQARTTSTLRARDACVARPQCAPQPPLCLVPAREAPRCRRIRGHDELHHGR